MPSLCTRWYWLRDEDQDCNFSKAKFQFKYGRTELLTLYPVVVLDWILCLRSGIGKGIAGIKIKNSFNAKKKSRQKEEMGNRTLLFVQYSDL